MGGEICANIEFNFPLTMQLRKANILFEFQLLLCCIYLFIF